MKHIKWFGVFAVVAVAGCGGAGSGGTNNVGNVLERILFVKTDAGGDKEIWTMNPDGTEKDQVTENDFADDYPVGCRLNHNIYYMADAPGAGGIYVSDNIGKMMAGRTGNEIVAVTSFNNH